MIQDIWFWAVLIPGAVLTWLLPLRVRPLFIAAISIAYLVRIDMASTLMLGAWTVVFYWTAPWCRRESGAMWLRVLILAILSFLAAYKYVPPILKAVAPESQWANVLIPLGISFYTFKLVHYAVEVARDHIKAHSFGQFLSYMYLLPIFTAGPIERFDHYMSNQAERFDMDLVVTGVTRIAHGMIKKFFLTPFVLVPLLHEQTSAQIVGNLPELSGWNAWWFCIITYLIVYMDFSAYTDIAVGASRLFGITIMENFNWPIFALNISDFWRRWHMTLSGWCRSYIYWPLIAVTRNPYLAVGATFLVIGLWHSGSWNYLAWGIYHGACSMLFGVWRQFLTRRGGEPRFPGHRVVLGWLPTFLVISASMAFPATVDVGGYAGLRLFAKLFFIDLPE